MKTTPNFLMIVLIAFAPQITKTNPDQTKPQRYLFSCLNICGSNNDAICPEAYSPPSETSTDISSNSSSPMPMTPKQKTRPESQIRELETENTKNQKLLSYYKNKISDLEHVIKFQDGEIVQLSNENILLKGQSIPPAPAFPDLNVSSRRNSNDEWSV